MTNEDWRYSEDKLKLRGECLHILLNKFSYDDPNKVNYTNHMSLAESIAGLNKTRDEYSMFTIPGFILSENIPLQGHVSTLILLEGLIGVILTLFFFITRVYKIDY